MFHCLYLSADLNSGIAILRILSFLSLLNRSVKFGNKFVSLTYATMIYLSTIIMFINKMIILIIFKISVLGHCLYMGNDLWYKKVNTISSYFTQMTLEI